MAYRADEPTVLSERLLQQNSQYEENRKSLLRRLRDGRQGLLAAAASHTGLSYARTRSLLLKQNLQQQDEEEQDSWWYYPIAQLRQFGRENLTSLLPLKAGLAAVIGSLLCFAPGFLSIFNKNGVWAVITIDIVMETNVGLTFSKGLNRTLGTGLASLLALAVDVLGDYMGSYEKYFLLVCTFLGGAIPTIFKFRRPFRDRWNYAVVMSMITFHLLILTQSDEKIKLPLLRLGLIAIGFVIASLVNMLLPNFAGNNINDLLAKNFERAGNVVEKCVLEYCQGTVLQQLPENLSQAANDELHSCFHEIVAADSEVEKLLKAARFEPPHGKFFVGYPWHLYRDVAENLRFAYYDVVALDSCLRAEIQAPLHLRSMFETEFMALGKECAEVFRALGKTMRYMRKHDFHQVLERAEEIALLLQHRIARQSDQLLQIDHQYPPRDDTGGRIAGFLREVLGSRSALAGSSDDDRISTDGIDQILDTSAETLPELHRKATTKEEDHEERKKKIEQKKPTLESKAGEFLKRRGSIGHHWETTVQRLAALSLLKFASLLIEIAAKGKYVVGVVDELAEKARFGEPVVGVSKPSDEFVSAFSTL